MRKLFYLLAVLFLSAPAFAADSPKENPAPALTPSPASANVSVKAEINKAFITIGDPITYTVTIKHDPSIQVTSSLNFPDQDILKVKKAEDFRKQDKKNIYEGKIFTLTAFSLGEYVLTPIEVQYVENGENKSIKTDPIYITVKSVAEGEEKNDIKGIKGLIKIPAKYLPLLYGAGILFLVLLGIYLYKRFRKEKPEDDGEKLTRSIEDEALFQLSKLFDSDLIRRGKIKEYYFELSDILKTYFERRYKILALESTTYEIMKTMKEKEIEIPLREITQEVLDACDLAKFAKWKPEPAEIISINQKSKQIIELARPKEIKEVPGGV